MQNLSPLLNGALRIYLSEGWVPAASPASLQQACWAGQWVLLSTLPPD